MENKTNPSKGLKNKEIVLKELFSKNLVIFVGVGLISGLFFGIYLLDVKNTNQLVFHEGPSISIVTEKFDFKKGEAIHIRIVNSGTVPLTFPDGSYGLHITGLSGILIFSPSSSQTISALAPNEKVEIVWDQIKNDGDTALEGLYKVSVVGFFGDDSSNIVEKSTTITIWK